MSSSTAGDRRWGTGRRSGMTILGKVAVPKPINLPSQRLENQGLDPNVEIVPKGTLSWGSKSSLNAWGSSSSPRADSGAGSPSHHSNRPSSGGTGTRPSTAGSDKAHEYSSTAWNSNSRPSSASGVLPSNHSSLAASRPHSAETRPGSSQLSRFAESMPENPAVWGQHAAEKLGVGPTKYDGFSLTSGDFPSLGAEKASSDHGPHVRPGSSGGSATMEGRGINSIEDGNVRSGEINTWKRENQPYSEDEPRHGIEERHMEAHGPQPYPNANFPPHHFDGWRGCPMNNHPGGVWYRGSPPPYGPPMGPGGFPMEPFPYYPPQVLSGPGRGPGPRGNHPTNGDMYRPPMPDSYVRPGMPSRPGFYPGPVPYEYYGPMGYCNPNNRDMPFVGMPAGPYGHSKHSGQGRNDLPGRSLPSEQVDPAHSQDARGPYKVLLKPQDRQFGKDETKRVESVTNRALNSEKVVQQRPSSSNDRGAEVKNDGNMESRRTFYRPESSSNTWEGGSVKSKLPEQEGKFAACDDIQSNKEENAAGRDASLIQKIEVLNAKTQTVDGWQNVSSSVDDQRNRSHKVPARNHRAIHGNDTKGHGSYELVNPATSIHPGEPAISGTRRSTQGTQGRGDSHSRGRVINEDTQGWKKKAAISESSSAISESRIIDSLNTDCIQKSGPPPLRKNEGESVISTDPNDAQRIRMREIAKQRALQRQKEEEERAKDQRAKALAKLEELNRRTQVVKEVSIKSVEADSAFIPEKSEDHGSLPTAPLSSSSDYVQQPSLEVKTGEDAAQELTASSEVVDDADTARAENPPRVHYSGASKQKRLGYKQKRNLVFEEKMAEKTQPEVVGLAPPPEAVNDGVLSSNSDMPTESTYPKRKNNRNGKKKHTAGDASGNVVREGKSAGESIAINREKAAEMEVGSGGLVAGSMDMNSLATEEEKQGRGKNQWKPQHSRKPQRNVHPAEKLHGTDAVIWAPVRAQPKPDVTDEVSQKAVAESVVSAKSVHQVPPSSRSKRVEMERYVPKPIAKEKAEQSVGKKELNPPEVLENPQKENNSSQGTEIIQSTAQKAGRQSKNGSKESTKTLDEGQFVNPERATKYNHDQGDKTASHDDEWNDGWNMTPETQVVGKDKGAGTGHIKQQSFKGNKKSNNREFSKVYVSQSDAGGPHRDRSSSHWKPKAHANQRGEKQIEAEVQAPANTGVEVKNTSHGRHHGGRGEWGSSGQDEVQHQRPSSSRDRQRQGFHYEYKRVGNGNREEGRESGGGGRYKEKGERGSGRRDVSGF